MSFWSGFSNILGGGLNLTGTILSARSADKATDATKYAAQANAEAEKARLVFAEKMQVSQLQQAQVQQKTIVTLAIAALAGVVLWRILK